jgi:hypothetical protein
VLQFGREITHWLFFSFFGVDMSMFESASPAYTELALQWTDFGKTRQ